MFNNNTTLTAITIGSTITSIENNAFQYCNLLSSITIPSSVTSIGDAAFAECSSLTSINIPGSVTSILSNAFYNCTNLIFVTINSNVFVTTQANSFQGIGSPSTLYTTIANDSNSNLTSKFTKVYLIGVTFVQLNSNQGPTITDASGNIYTLKTGTDIPDYTYINSNTSLNTINFSNTTYTPYITNLILGSNVTAIGANAFQGCTALTNITVPPSSITIHPSAFRTIGTAVSINGSPQIPNNMFNGNTTLTRIAIGSAINSIGTSAFNGCTSLNLVYVYSKVYVNTGVTAFNTNPNASLYTTLANIDNTSLTQYFANNVYLLQTPLTYYYTIQSNVEKDLSQVFYPLNGRPGSKTGFIIENYNNTGENIDLSQIFEPYISGSQTQETGFIIENYNNQEGATKDLNLIFKPL